MIKFKMKLILNFFGKRFKELFCSSNSLSKWDETKRIEKENINYYQLLRKDPFMSVEKGIPR